MRILLISREYPPETAKGGIGTQAHMKAHGLTSLGHSVVVISESIHDRRLEYKDNDVDVVRIPNVSPSFKARTASAEWLVHSFAVAVEVEEQLRRGRFDLAEFPEWGAEGFTYLVNRTEWNDVPVVLQIHGPLTLFAHTIGWPDPASEFFRIGTFMERTCLQLADRVYSSSAFSARSCAEHYGLDLTRVPTIHTGVDSSLFTPPAHPKSAAPTIVFVGRINRNKGAFQLMEAAARLAADIPGLRVRLIGRAEPNVLDQLNLMAARAGYPDLVEFTGFVGREALPSLLGSAHVFALPSNYEPGPGLANLEAMACGLPVVACESAGSAEVVRHGSTGLLVPPADPDALTAALRQILTDSSLRERLGLNARAYVETVASSNICFRRLEEFYTEVTREVSVGAASGR
ncbi:MAG: glycosyltransferase family 4 protein [Vicinamibacterales bacterium]